MAEERKGSADSTTMIRVWLPKQTKKKTQEHKKKKNDVYFAGQDDRPTPTMISSFQLVGNGDRVVSSLLEKELKSLRMITTARENRMDRTTYSLHLEPIDWALSMIITVVSLGKKKMTYYLLQPEPIFQYILFTWTCPQPPLETNCFKLLNPVR